MINDKVRDYFGDLPVDQEQYLNDYVNCLDEDKQESIYKYLTENNRQSKGCPDISALKKAISEICPPKIYYWAKCAECGCEYEYELPMCPDCFKNGLECHIKSIIKSELQPPMKVIRYNKHFVTGDGKEKSCYGCENNENSQCQYFGNSNWECKHSTFEACKCNACCSLHKSKNRELYERKRTLKLSCATPLRRD